MDEETASERPREAASQEPADLSRLRIPREGAGVPTARGFPLLRVLLAVTLVLLGLLFREEIVVLFGGGGPEVRTGLVERVVPGQARAGDVSANGYIVADRKASLATVLSGRLVELNAKEGDIVEQNAAVARIQFDDYEVEVQRAGAVLASARARLEEVRARSKTAAAQVQEARSDVEAARLTSARLQAEVTAQRELEGQARENQERLEREVTRNRSLFERKLINTAEWDRIQTNARTAGMLLLSAKARGNALAAAELAWAGQIRKREASMAVAVSSEAASVQGEAVAEGAVQEATEAQRFARIQLEKTIIRAPFRGLVIRRDAELGEVLAPMGAGNSRGSVMTIVEPESLEVQVELSERRIARVHEGDRASVFLTADPETRLPGVVRKIWPRADRSTGSIEVRVRFDKRPDTVRPDMAVRVVFIGPEGAEPESGPAYVTVPREAVAQRAAKPVVFLVQDGRVRLVPVDLLKEREQAVEVSSTLKGGERVVLSPPADLADGDAVRAP